MNKATDIACPFCGRVECNGIKCTPTDPTPPAPAPLTAEEEAPLRSVVRPGAVIPCDVQSVGALIHVIRRLLATLDATRAELARVVIDRDEWHVQHENLRGLYEREKELRAGFEARATVLAIRCLAHRDVPQHNTSEITGAECGACIVAERDAARAALERVEKERHYIGGGELRRSLREQLADADQAGRALVGALEAIVRATSHPHGSGSRVGCPICAGHDALTHATRWRTGEETG